MKILHRNLMNHAYKRFYINRNEDIKKLTGRMSPCQVRMFDSSTCILVKFFIAEVRKSPSS